MKRTTNVKIILTIAFFLVSIILLTKNAWSNNTISNEITIEELREINYYDFVKDFNSVYATDSEQAYYFEAATWYNNLVSKEELEEIKNRKNRKYEIALSEEKLSKDELLAKFLPTVVSITINAKLENDNNYFIRFGGNVYDITDDAIYIITCSHPFNTTWSLGKEYKKTNYIDVMFIDGSTIRLDENCFYRAKGNDLGLIKINIELIHEETLNVLKSINIDNMFLISFENVIGYTVRCSNDVSCYSVYDFTCERAKKYGYSDKILYGYGSMIEGCSGIGIFDTYGNYMGYCENSHYVRYFTIFPDFYNLLLESGY